MQKQAGYWDGCSWKSKIHDYKTFSASTMPGNLVPHPRYLWWEIRLSEFTHNDACHTMEKYKPLRIPSYRGKEMNTHSDSVAKSHKNVTNYRVLLPIIGYRVLIILPTLILANF